MKSTFLPPAKEFWGKVIFSEAYVSHSVQREACVAKGVHGRGAYVSGACVAGRHAWQGHACMVGEPCVAGRGGGARVQERWQLKRAVRIPLE